MSVNDRSGRPHHVELGWSRFADPHVEDRLILEEGEHVIYEIGRHWVTRLVPGFRVVLGMVCFLVMPRLGHLWWIALVAGLVLLDAVLAPRGYEVIRVNTGQQALDVLVKQHIDLMLLGVILPGTDGFAVCAKSRAD